MDTTARDRAVSAVKSLAVMRDIFDRHAKPDQRFWQNNTIIAKSREEMRASIGRLGNRANSVLHWRINERACYEVQMREHQTADGFFWYQDGGRDCDMCEATSRPYKMRASLMLWQRHVNNLYDWAEGPVWFWMVKECDLPKCEYGSRDLALEAFEDGHSHVVSRVRFETN